VLCGFAEYRLLDDLIISSEVGWRKPAPKFFEAVCQRLACEPGQILFIGDSIENDYAGARSAGMRALLIDAAGRHVQSDVRRIGSLAELVGS
jgi:putative hydrolase of the HAD superfamily